METTYFELMALDRPILGNSKMEIITFKANSVLAALFSTKVQGLFDPSSINKSAIIVNNSPIFYYGFSFDLESSTISLFLPHTTTIGAIIETIREELKITPSNFARTSRRYLVGINKDPKNFYIYDWSPECNPKVIHNSDKNIPTKKHEMFKMAKTLITHYNENSSKS